MNSEDINGSGRRIGAESGGGWARACDVCRGAPCAVFCRADAAYLCASCDARVHAANRVASRHERVWVCEACERAPAALTCRADNAALCTACDAQVHSANPLAQRHQRVPILPIQPGRLVLGPDFPPVTDKETDEVITGEDEDEAASWLLPEPARNNAEFLFEGEVDEYLNFAEYNHVGIGGSEGVVPMQQQQQHQHQSQRQQGQEQHQSYQMEMEYEVPKPSFTYTASLSHSVSLSSMEASVVPDTTMTDISNCRIRPGKGTIDLFSGAPVQMAAQFSPMDREARVLRYREKKKARKFEKTIRYASRKAYAETRPRIKGRFAKRSEVKLKVADQMFSSSMAYESSYGIVPSF